MGAQAAGVFLAAQPHTGREFKRQHAAHRHAFAVQKAVAVACGGLKRVAKCMPKVQQCAVALFGLVALHDFGFHLTRPFNRLHPRGHIARGKCRSLPLKPVKERRIAQQPVFHDLAIPRQEIAWGERAKYGGIGQHEAGLVECTDQVLAKRRVDPRFATHGTINLRQQGRGHLHKTHTTPHNGGGKARQITDHTTAKGDNHIAALDFLGDKPFNGAAELVPAFCGLARRQDQDFGCDTTSA